MGGTTFDHYARGTDVQSAFRDAHEQASFEHGHGGYSGTIAEKPNYTVIATTPLLMSEAYALSEQLVNASDPRISDKWGPAGALPVIDEERTVTVSDFGYTPTAGHAGGEPDPALLEAVQPLVKLKRGEKIKSIWVNGYSTPEVNRYGGGFRSPSRFRSKCTAQVTITLPPMTRVEKLSVIIPGGLDYNDRAKAIASEVDARLKLKAGEKRIDYRETSSKPGKPKVTAEAPKGSTDTRFIVLRNSGGRMKQPTRSHGTWETGFDTQSAARAWATEVMNDDSPSRGWADNEVLEVESVTRRSDGQPLVSVRREVAGHIVEVDVTIKLAQANPKTTPDGWLFFGWASC